jgi:hypothetical protein
MKTLKQINKHVAAKDSMKKISEILKKEFPYTQILHDTTPVDGFYNISLEHIKSEDVDKFISVLHDSSSKHGIGVGLPILIRYNKIFEESLV